MVYYNQWYIIIQKKEDAFLFVEIDQPKAIKGINLCGNIFPTIF